MFNLSWVFGWTSTAISAAQEKLKNSCRQFALKSKAVKQQLKEGSLPKAVEQLLGHATQGRSF